MIKNDIKFAHTLCSNHRETLINAESCGCFYCLEIYSPKEISEWIDQDQTALCEKCGIDSVLPESDQYDLSREFLEKMHEYWFN